MKAFRSIFCFGAFAAASAITLPVGQNAASSQPVGIRAGDESTPRKFITLAGNNHHAFQRQTVPDGGSGILQPYDFGYNIQDEYGNNQFRQESADNQSTVKGSYGYTDALGLYRRVEYVADENGFRAEIKSNEPGVKGDQPASAHFTVEEVPQSVLRTLPASDGRHHHGSEKASLRVRPAARSPASGVRFVPIASSTSTAQASASVKAS
ncbi:cuticle protein 19.8-like [Varroa jacobsoni]|uniref:Uncharacterized protein n=1 Tax=Varroa destructor TaxID=109461 RepID=A0A7M7MB44_VARDE|nr:cuticle protein 19.8-like [Varroa destructor]XP_022703499.1 cuticle protein 19.8-like [Varroa jacobsoni]